MKWIGDRVTFEDKKESVSFIIYPPQLGKKKIVLLVWFILWLAVGVYMTTLFFQDYAKEAKLSLFVFMVFWLYFAIRVLRTIVYLYFGREYILLDNNSLKIKKATGEYGKANHYFIENITKLETLTLKENSIKKSFEDSPWVRGTDRIQFEYFQKTFGFGKKLNQKDADMIFKIITKRIDKFIRKKKKNN